MKIAIPIRGTRISPLFDVAKRIELLDIGPDETVVHREAYTETADPIEKTMRLIERGTDVLICGAISWPLELMLTSRGVQVIPNTCGPAKEVIAAFVAGCMTEESFLMPGCTGQRRCRCRHGSTRWRKKNARVAKKTEGD
jgi:predicted Fe-Mo cluster-binding NifX family protein